MRKSFTGLVAALFLLTLALPAAATPHTGNPGGNCDDSIVVDGVTHRGNKLDNEPRGTFNLGDGVSITITNDSITASGGSVILCIKGSNTNSGTVTIADGQTVTYTDGGISNVVVYVVIPPPIFPEGTLTVSKTAAGAFDRTVTWDITKSVDPDHHRLMVGGSADSDYTVDVDKSEVSDNYTIAGTITIAWSGSDAPLNLTSVVDSIAGATVDCPSMTVAPNDSIECDYTAPGDLSVTSNTVEVDGSYTIPAGYRDAGDVVPVDSSATSPTFTYVENLIGYDVVDVTDSFDGGAAELLGTINDDAQFLYPRTFTCSERGTFTFPNRATIVETGQYDDALVTVECVAALEACTPGFWGGKSTREPFTPANRPAWDYLASEHGVSPSTTLASVGLTGYNGLTFNQVLNTTGRGNYSGSLIWHAAAAYLNAQMAEDGLLDFPMTTDDVLALYAAGDKDALANANEDGDCPFGADSTFSS